MRIQEEKNNLKAVCLFYLKLYRTNIYCGKGLWFWRQICSIETGLTERTLHSPIDSWSFHLEFLWQGAQPNLYLVSNIWNTNKRWYKQSFGDSVSFFFILPCFFDLLTMFIDSTTKITPHSLANAIWGSFFALIHMTVIKLLFGPNKYFLYL